jgi:hypothetical protein
MEIIGSAAGSPVAADQPDTDGVDRGSGSTGLTMQKTDAECIATAKPIAATSEARVEQIKKYLLPNRFPKGKSGNPKGRPRRVIDALRTAEEASERAMKVLVKLLAEDQPPQVRIAAANAILDRAVGKPKQQVEAKVEHSADSQAAGPVSETDRWLAELAQERGGKEAGPSEALPN